MIAHSPQRSVGSTDQTRIWSLKFLQMSSFANCHPIAQHKSVSVRWASLAWFGGSGAQLYLRPKIDLLTAKTRAEPIIAEAINGCDGGWSEKFKFIVSTVIFFEVWYGLVTPNPDMLHNFVCSRVALTPSLWNLGPPRWWRRAGEARKEIWWCRRVTGANCWLSTSTCDWKSSTFKFHANCYLFSMRGLSYPWIYRFLNRGIYTSTSNQQPSTAIPKDNLVIDVASAPWPKARESLRRKTKGR